jgi:hypothetical protein
VRLLLLLLLLPLVLIAAPTGAVAATAEGEEVDGGPAATRATPIEPGTGYIDDVRAGEARWYTVELQAGQSFDITLTEYGEVEYGCCIEVRLHDAGFDQLAFDNMTNSDGTATTSRVASSEDGVEETGSYYAEVRLTGSAVRPVTYEFVVNVAGEPVGGAGEEQESPSPSAAESPTAGDSDDGDTDETEPVATESDGGGSLLLWVIVALLALLVVLLLVAVVFLLIRMQKQQSGRGGSAH